MPIIDGALHEIYPSYHPNSIRNIRIEEKDNQGTPSIVTANFDWSDTTNCWVRVFIKSDFAYGLVASPRPFTYARIMYKTFSPEKVFYSEDELETNSQLLYSYTRSRVMPYILAPYKRYNIHLSDLKNLTPVSYAATETRGSSTPTVGTRMGASGIEQYSTSNNRTYNVEVNKYGLKNTGTTPVYILDVATSQDGFIGTKYKDGTVIVQPGEVIPSIDAVLLDEQKDYYALIEDKKTDNINGTTEVTNKSENTIKTIKLTGAGAVKTKLLTKGVWRLTGLKKLGEDWNKSTNDEVFTFGNDNKLKMAMSKLVLDFEWRLYSNFSKINITEPSGNSQTLVIHQLDNSSLIIYWTQQATMMKFTH